MAKSLRSKTKRSFRQKKRESGEYAAAAAGRLHRLNSKLLQVTKKDTDGGRLETEDVEANEDGIPAPELDDSMDQPESMAVDSESSSKRISTHGPRGSRREEWRKSKGMPARATPHGMNRQGTVAAKRKAGRSKRRR
ncbi:hypothetical protein JR316_0004723 [Psilocybe cubensis]|uniref:Uncharacterized protein n=1 Tax=Psilocybe cubensis TaxID=181762 RepID=A0ACB8H4C0_PSICU|nr:hypothetical protein JR316_0004723 [Psilocybe cubensis]KAH9482623.1 hypothetical protein JR316_0004723 [Psilocybe cubensis]